MPTTRKPIPNDAVKRGTITATGVVTQNLDMQAGQNYYGYNTIALWGTWVSTTVKLQAQLATHTDQFNPPPIVTGKRLQLR